MRIRKKIKSADGSVLSEKTGRKDIKAETNADYKAENRTSKGQAEKIKNKGRGKGGDVAKASTPAKSIPRGDLPLFKGYIRLRITGLNQIHLLNALKAEVKSVKNIKRPSPKTLELTVSKTESKKTFAILQKMCYNYSVIADSGVRTLFASCLRHLGLLAGAFVFGAAILLASQTVWKIEISGNQAVDSLTISRSLKECGVSVGVFKKRVDTGAVAAALREVDGIAAAAAEVKGTTVYIRLLEEKQYIPPDPEQTDSFTNIVSGYDAEVTRVSVRSGTGEVKPGSRVAAGAVLIRAERLNSVGEPMGPVKAEGSVYGKVAFKETHIFSKTEQILSRKGKKNYTQLSLFGLNIGKKPPKGGERVTTSEKLFFIPITVTRTEHYETEIITRERNIDAYVDELKSEAVLNNVIKAGGSEIETVTTLSEMDGGLYMLNIYILAEVLIGGT